MSHINMSVERPHATYYVLAMAMFALSVTLCEIFSVETCTILTLTFRMTRGQMSICRSKVHMRLSICWKSQRSSCVLIVDVCEMIAYEHPEEWFESVTFKIKIKDVDDSDENRQWNDTFAFLCKEMALLGPAICSQYTIVHFYSVRTV